MALTPFAKAEDLKVLAPALSDDEAALAVGMASTAVRAAVGWDVDLSVGRTYTRVIPFRRRGTGGEVTAVILPAMNVTAVASVVVDGVTLAPAEYDATESGIVYLDRPAYEKVVVTYTAGYKRIPDAAPPVFREVTLEYAARLAGNPGGVRAYTMGQVSETFEGTLEDALRRDTRLDPFRVDQ